MLAMLPFLSFAFLALGFRRRKNGWRGSLLLATIPCGLFVALATEGLSCFYWITRPGVAVAWLCFACVCLYWMVRSGAGTRPGASENGDSPAHLDLGEKIGLCGMVILFALTGLTAWFCAPDNWDAMQYHLPRMVLWISNHSVQPYPTTERQQLWMPPFAEYAMLHLDLLYGSDRLVNLVQWLASVGCAVGISLIAELLGGSRRTQIFAAALAATLPSAILGATNPKNDLVLSYWIVLAVCLLIRWRTHQTWLDTLAIAAALSLAVFTKGTAYAFLPFLVLACALGWSWLGARRFLLRLPATALVCILVNGPLWVRNYRSAGSIFGLAYFDGKGPVSGRTFAISPLTLTGSIANFLRNIGLNIGVPNHRANEILTHILSRCILLFGVDPNDPSQKVISKNGSSWPFAVNFTWRDEFGTGNTFHLFLFVVALLICCFAFRKLNRNLVWLGGGIVGAFFLYSALLRWAPTNARYQLPLFLLSTAVVALTFARVLPKVAITALMVLLLISALPPTLANTDRPLLTGAGLKGSILTTARDETYFFDVHKDFSSSFIAAARATSSGRCRSVGVDASLLHFEYPLFALLTEYGGPTKISYAGVDNPTADLKPKLAETPCAIVCLGCAGAADKLAAYSNPQRETETFGKVVVFIPKDNAAAEAGSSAKK